MVSLLVKSDMEKQKQIQKSKTKISFSKNGRKKENKKGGAETSKAPPKRIPKKDNHLKKSKADSPP